MRTPALGGQVALVDGSARRVDQLDPARVRELVAALDRDHGRLDLLVVGLYGADLLTQFGTRPSKHDPDRDLRMRRIGIAGHVIAVAGPRLARTPGALVVEVTDGPTEDDRAYGSQGDLSCDLTKTATERLVLGLAHDLAPTATAVGLTASERAERDEVAEAQDRGLPADVTGHR